MLKEKLGGWHRLWIVLSIAYLLSLLCYLLVSGDYPAPDKYQHTDEILQHMTREHALLIAVEVDDPAPAYTLKMPNGYILNFPASISRKESEEIARDYRAALEAVVLKERKIFALVVATFWIVPIFGLYLLGRALHWVYRGFRPEPRA